MRIKPGEVKRPKNKTSLGKVGFLYHLTAKHENLVINQFARFPFQGWFRIKPEKGW
jgi:hypothetical protein